MRRTLPAWVVVFGLGPFAGAWAAPPAPLPPPPEEELFALLGEAIARVDVREQGCAAVAASLEAFVAERKPLLDRLHAAADARFREADGEARLAILRRLDGLARAAFTPALEEQVRLVRPECPREWPRIQAAVRAVGWHFGRLTRYFDPALHALQTLRVVLGIVRERGADCSQTRRAVDAFVAERRAEFGSLVQAMQGLSEKLSPSEAEPYAARLQAEMANMGEELTGAMQRLQAECPQDLTWFTQVLTGLIGGPQAEAPLPAEAPPRE